jgi:hypothetical protein
MAMSQARILTSRQTIFADDSFSKPYFVTYVNTTFFIIPLIPMFVHHLWLDRSNTIYQKPLLAQCADLLSRRAGKISLLRDHESSSSSTRAAATTKPPKCSSATRCTPPKTSPHKIPTRA